MLPYPAAEHAVALITDLYKKISKECRVMKDGGWQAYVSESLNGRTLGVLGLGNLGSRVAKFGQGNGNGCHRLEPEPDPGTLR